MLLLLARHADAGVSDPSRWPDDGERPLTELGRTTQRRMSELVRRAGFAPTAIVSSGALRARQTAAIIGEICQVDGPVRISNALITTPDLKAIGADLRAFGSANIVAITGHSPYMEELASLLLAGAADALRIEFSKSAIMVIRTDAMAAGAGELVAFLQP